MDATTQHRRRLKSKMFTRVTTGTCGSRVFLPTILLAVQLLGGCWGGSGKFVSPDIDSTAAADKAFEQYDSNGDGYLDSEELHACPGVKHFIYLYDVDNDSQVSKLEMQDRIASWKNGPAMMTLNCRVTLDGRPLAGAEVNYEPEVYLKEWLPTASGTCDDNGTASIAVPAEHLPSSHQRVKALYTGTYKIRVTHPQTSIPDKYNVNTNLGHEVSKETGGNPTQELSLRSR